MSSVEIARHALSRDDPGAARRGGACFLCSTEEAGGVWSGTELLARHGQCGARTLTAVDAAAAAEQRRCVDLPTAGVELVGAQFRRPGFLSHPSSEIFQGLAPTLWFAGDAGGFVKPTSLIESPPAAEFRPRVLAHWHFPDV